MLEGYVEGNNYARFDTHSYHSYRKTHFNARLDWSAKSRSRAPGVSAYLKSMPRTISIQGLTLAAITAAEQRTLMLDST